MARWYLIAAAAAVLVPGHGLAAALLRTIVRHFLAGAL
jgi:uncharacterized membrane protein YjjP (DUF1212 family)